MKNRPVSGTALETGMCLWVVPMIVTSSRTSEPALMLRWVSEVGLTATASRSRASSFSLSLMVRLGRFRNWKKRPVMIHGIRDTKSTSVPITEALSRKALASPLAAVMVVLTASTPITIPRVVSTPLAVFARIAARASLNASTVSWTRLKSVSPVSVSLSTTTVPQPDHPIGVPGDLVLVGHQRIV